MRVDPNYVTNLVSSLDQSQATEQQLTSELSSGVSITSLSQNPVASGENVLLLNQIQQDDSFTQSSSLVTSQLQVADSTLGSVVTQLTQAISLATSANNGTMNVSDVKSIGNQLSGILDEVQSLANTNYQIFLSSGTNSVFGALNSLIADYSTGTVDASQAISDTESLGTALSFVSQQRVTIDNSISQLGSASDAMTNEQTQLIAAQTNLMQADVAQVSTQLSLSETQQTALEDVIAQLNSTSNDLFSKLPQ